MALNEGGKDMGPSKLITVRVVGMNTPGMAEAGGPKSKEYSVLRKSGEVGEVGEVGHRRWLPTIHLPEIFGHSSRA